MLTTLRPLHYLWKALKGESSPNQIAWAMALGMLVGLIPKGNLTAWAFGFVLFGLRVNLGAGLLTAIIFTSLNSLFDPLSHGIGLRLLSLQKMQQLLVRLHDAPLVPWLALNNTVVLGSTVLGLALCYPVKRMTQRCVEMVQSRWPRKPASDAEAFELDVAASQVLQGIAASRAGDRQSQTEA